MLFIKIINKLNIIPTHVGNFQRMIFMRDFYYLDYRKNLNHLFQHAQNFLAINCIPIHIPRKGFFSLIQPHLKPPAYHQFSIVLPYNLKISYTRQRLVLSAFFILQGSSLIIILTFFSIFCNF